MIENNDSFFLRKKLHFYLTLAVIITTLISSFNLNSWLIIALVICRLLDGRPLSLTRTAFSNKYFLAYFSIFFLELIGLFYTHDFNAASKHVVAKATLVAIAFVFCAGPFTEGKGYQRLMKAYGLSLAAICVYCLGMAVFSYWQGKDPDVFFYHKLTDPVGVNAVFFSAYVIVVLLFLLYGKPWQEMKKGGLLRTGLVLFFTGMMVLLSSKLLLIVLLVIFIGYLTAWGKGVSRMGKGIFIGGFIILAAVALTLTNNPVSRRYKEILHGDFAIHGEKDSLDRVSFNGVNLRLLIWKNAYDILNEHKAWVFGVTAGDSQRLLNEKYEEEGISNGYQSYNFHNQYIEVLVRSGIFGLCIFLLDVGLLIWLARSSATVEAGYTMALVLLMALTESTLEMQHTTFFSCFFPLLMAYAVGKKVKPKTWN